MDASFISGKMAHMTKRQTNKQTKGQTEKWQTLANFSEGWPKIGIFCTPYNFVSY